MIQRIERMRRDMTLDNEELTLIYCAPDVFQRLRKEVVDVGFSHYEISARRTVLECAMFDGIFVCALTILQPGTMMFIPATDEVVKSAEEAVGWL